MYLPDLIEVEVDIINPVQVSAKDMDTKRLKEEFGDKLTFGEEAATPRGCYPSGPPRTLSARLRGG